MNFMPSRKMMSKRGLIVSSNLTRFDIDVRDPYATLSANLSIRLYHYDSKQNFTITPACHYQVLAGMKRAVEWFYDEGKPDLFVVNEKDQLVFNNDYNELSVLVHSAQAYNEHLEIRPCVNNADSDRGHEGVILFINAMDGAVVLNREEFEELYVLLSGFSYQAEMELLVKVDMLATQIRIHQPM